MGLFSGIFKKEKKPTNVDRGKEVEHDFKTSSELQGYHVERTGVGSDHKRSYRDLNGRKHTEMWEEKRNNSPLSERQQQTRGLKIYRRYDPSSERPLGETRVEDRYGNRLERDMFTGKYRRVPKRENDPFGLNQFSMGNSRPKRTRANDDPFGVGSMFGGSTHTSRKKRRNDDPFGLFG